MTVDRLSGWEERLETAEPGEEDRENEADEAQGQRTGSAHLVCPGEPEENRDHHGEEADT